MTAGLKTRSTVERRQAPANIFQEIEKYTLNNLLFHGVQIGKDIAMFDQISLKEFLYCEGRVQSPCECIARAYVTH